MDHIYQNNWPFVNISYITYLKKFQPYSNSQQLDLHYLSDEFPKQTTLHNIKTISLILCKQQSNIQLIQWTQTLHMLASLTCLSLSLN